MRPAHATAFVLAAGLGTRLRPLTEHLPKPLVPVCGVPMLAYSLALCARHGHRNVIVNAHWLAHTLAPWEGDHEGVNVSVAVEAPDILGTGGGLRAVRDHLAERFAVVNADVLCDVNLTALLDAVPLGGGAMALRPMEAERYGVVAADSTGVVVELVTVAHATPSGEVDRDTHFTGIHALHRDALDLVPDGFACVVRTAYRELVPRRLVNGLRHTGAWLDVGDPEAYLATNLAVLAGEVQLALDPRLRAAWCRSGRRSFGDSKAAHGAMIRGDAWVGVGAQIEGSTLQNAVIGAHAVVHPRAELIDSVVWDGCEVPAGRYERAVVYPGGVLRLG